MQDGHSTDKAGNVGSAPQHPSVSVPQVMLKEGNTLLNAGKYDEGIELLEDALRAAIVQAGNELDYSLAKYYYAYGDGIIAKLSTSTEIFGEAIQEAITRKEGEISQEIKKEEATAPKSQPDEDEKKAPEAEAEAEASGDDVDDGSDKDVKITVVEPEEKKGLAVPIPPPADPGKKPQENEEPTEDVQIAWENMETARVIAEKRRSDLAATARDSDEYKEAARLAAKVYMSIGEILSMQEREDDALLEFSKALALRLEVEGKESRGLAETYFTIGTAILRKKGKERQAIENFHSAAKILEANLCRALGTPFDDREERKVSDYQISSSPLVKPQPGDSGEVKELREVLSGVYMKIEDALLQEKELPELNKVMAQEGAEKAAKKEGFDKQVFAPEKAVDLGVLGKSKKRATDETRRVENADGGAKANSGNEGETKKEGGEKKAKTKEEEEHK